MRLPDGRGTDPQEGRGQTSALSRWAATRLALATAVVSLVLGLFVGFVSGLTLPLVVEREALFPTAAVVEGRFVRDGVPVGGVDVVLDGGDRDQTNGAGEFRFAGVPAGLHTLEVEVEGRTVLALDFYVGLGTSFTDLGQLELAHRVPPSPTPPASRASPSASPPAGRASPAASPAAHD